MTSRFSALTSIFLSSLIVLLTGFSIALIHNSGIFIFLLAFLFFISTIKAFFATYIKHQKGKIYRSILQLFFSTVSQSTTSAKSVPQADKPNNIEIHKVHRDDCSKKREVGGSSPSSTIVNKAHIFNEPDNVKVYNVHDEVDGSKNEQTSQVSQSPRPADKTPDSDYQNVDEWLKIFEDGYPDNVHESFISLDDYLNQNNYYLKDEIIEAIEWKRFELLCHLIFKASGYNCELTGDGADEGVDIRIFDKNDSGKTICLVQCKKWQTNRKIKREHIQQLRGQMATENVEKGGYCSTVGFTLPAREYAEANNIELFDQQKIVESFNKLNVYDRQSILSDLLAGDYWIPSCASCGEKFEVIKQKSGKLMWGCRKIKEHGWSQIPYYEAVPIKNVR